MKKTLLSVACAIIAMASLNAQTTTTTTTTSTGTGTLTEYTPGSAFVVKETAGPVTYRYGDTVVYATKSGKVLTDEQVRTRIRVGTPVSVQYITRGEDRVISRVEVDDD
jgi:hypothetical protein